MIAGLLLCRRCLLCLLSVCPICRVCLRCCLCQSCKVARGPLCKFAAYCAGFPIASVWLVCRFAVLPIFDFVTSPADSLTTLLLPLCRAAGVPACPSAAGTVRAGCARLMSATPLPTDVRGLPGVAGVAGLPVLGLPGQPVRRSTPLSLPKKDKSLR